MARGWESKSVESQIEDARAKREHSEPTTPEERELRARREGLEMSRRRVMRELAETQSPLRRTSLEHALAFLDEELSKLRGSGSPE